MRLTIGLGVLLLGCAAASAEEARAPLRTAPAPSLSPTMQRQHEESLARQATMDKRMDARTRHAIGSVCVGCGGTAVRPPRAKPETSASAEDQPGEASAFDPAEASVD